MLKKYIAFVWDINQDSGLIGGWDHALKSKDGIVRSWDTFNEAALELSAYIPSFRESQARFAEVKAQIVNLETGEAVPFN